MIKIDIPKIQKLIKNHPEAKLFYLFGSQVGGDTGPLSDYDFAVYLDGGDKHKMANIQLDLIAGLTDILKSDKVDLTLLNLNESPEFKYHVISEGKILYEEEPYRLIVEPRIITEYCDFRQMLKQNNLLSPTHE
jgi:predicted nucleotidyltransferase